MTRNFNNMQPKNSLFNINEGESELTVSKIVEKVLNFVQTNDFMIIVVVFLFLVVVVLFSMLIRKVYKRCKSGKKEFNSKDICETTVSTTELQPIPSPIEENLYAVTDLNDNFSDRKKIKSWAFPNKTPLASPYLEQKPYVSKIRVEFPPADHYKSPTLPPYKVPITPHYKSPTLPPYKVPITPHYQTPSPFPHRKVIPVINKQPCLPPKNLKPINEFSNDEKKLITKVKISVQDLEQIVKGNVNAFESIYRNKQL